MDNTANNSELATRPLLPTIGKPFVQSSTNAQIIARARSQLASRMMGNQSTSAQPGDAEMVRPDDISNPTDNNFEAKEFQQPIGNVNSPFVSENLETQVSDHSGEFQRRNEDSLFCSPGPYENRARSNHTVKSPSRQVLSGDTMMYEENEQSETGPSITHANGNIELTPKRKRTLLPPFEMDNALTGVRKPETKKRKSSQNRKGNRPNIKRKSKSSQNYWQKNPPTLSSLGTANSIQHAMSNAGKLEIPASSSRNKDKALKELVATAPTENSEEAATDRQLMIQASQKFIRKPRADGKVGWLHPNMTTSLYHYQLIGVGFMRNREKSAECPSGGFLCDAMGFGKTIQIIANIIDDHQQSDQGTDNVTLVVVPSHLTKHWNEQFAQHCKKGVLGPVIEYHARSRMNTTDAIEFLGSFSVIITTYNEVRTSIPKFKPPAGVTLECEIERQRMEFIQENRGPLHHMNFKRIILDEAHEIKNPYSKTSIAVRMLSGRFRWAVSGTPLHNGIHELYPYLDFLRVPVGGDFSQFVRECLKYHGKVPWIDHLLRKCMLKRGHDETLFGFPILKLPGVECRDLVVNFNATERALYQGVAAMFLETNHVFSKPVKNYGKEYQNKLTLLSRLRMFTCHPLLAQMVLKDFLTIDEVQSLRLSIRECSEPEDEQMCSLLEDLIREQKLLENEQEQSSSADKAQLPKLQVTVSQKLVNDFVDTLKLSGEEQDKSKKCIRCHCPPTSAHLTSCLHIYCQDCAGETMIQAGSVCDCGAPVGQTVFCESLEPLIARATRQSEGNQIVPLNPRKRSRGKPNKKGSESGDLEETVMDWVDRAGHKMPGAKLTAIRSCLADWFKRSRGTKVVIFTQFLGMTSILSSMCQKNGWGHLLHTGQMLLQAREENIETFSEDPAARILICSFKTANTGIDLTAANKCILVDPWWNEAMEQQACTFPLITALAFSRIFRIRQERNVEFVRIVVQNSIDDRIQLIQNEKTDGIEKVMGPEVLTSRDTLANLCTVLGVEQDDSTEKGYRFISDKEAERRCEVAPVTVLDGEAGKAPGQADADTCASAASNINGLSDSGSNPPGVGAFEDTESTESSANNVGAAGTINAGETCEISSIGDDTLAIGPKGVIGNGTTEPVGPR
ncbi:hypothetical protein EMPG_10086 [Blastomyces silverae]|uniref:Uncharacterized protein n=1 Tax=Blastomyces silverae TaxID=2060906 RepID=A0A0H1B611_9EURO|nr:hypothetical protein EMPG_10086 [Blastomyces silverae]